MTCSILIPQLRIKGRERGRMQKKKKKREEKKRNVGGKFTNGFYPIPFNEGLSTEEREIDIDLRTDSVLQIANSRSLFPLVIHASEMLQGRMRIINNVVAACRVIFWYRLAWIGDSIEIDELLIGWSVSSQSLLWIVKIPFLPEI